MKINTQYEIGDKVWTVEYTENDGRFHTFCRTIEYIKVNKRGDILYGFIYGIEINETRCFWFKEDTERLLFILENILKERGVINA